MSTKIQINSLAALERLIGGDNTLEIEIRQSIVTEFTKKHLKGLVDSHIIQTASNELRASIDREITKQISATIGDYQQSGFSGRKFYLNNDIKETIKNQLQIALNKILDEAIKEYMPGVEKQIEEAFVKVMDDRIYRIVRKKVDAHLEKIKDAL